MSEFNTILHDALERQKQELKPCPFCGGVAVLKKVPDTSVMPYYVRCDNKFCSMWVVTCNRRTEREAMELWNRRADANN